MEKEVQIQIGKIVLKGKLIVPQDFYGLIIFSHGSGSSRKSPRNQFVADYLSRRGYSCFLFDLLTESEDEIYSNRFDIELLAERLYLATQEIKAYFSNNDLPILYFGASTGAAAALIASCKKENKIAGVVSRGGRPDLATAYLHKINVPVLFLVGGYDVELLKIHEEILKKISGKKKLVIIPEAGHLFEEKGKLLEVSELAFHWISKLIPEPNAV